MFCYVMSVTAAGNGLIGRLTCFKIRRNHDAWEQVESGYEGTGVRTV